MYPALVNNTTIDFLGAWPEKALQEVASKFLSDIDLNCSGNDDAVQVRHVRAKVMGSSILNIVEATRIHILYCAPVSSRLR